MEDVKFASVKELSRALAAKEVSAVELAQAYLDRMEAHRDLNCFLDVRPEVTLEEARAADKRIAEGTAGRLTGVPIAHKDIFVTKKWASTAGSKMLEGYMSPFDATVVKKLAAAGMVTLGKLNCDEFAMGSANENSAYGKVYNPWDKNAVPGGSSGGSASCALGSASVSGCALWPQPTKSAAVSSSANKYTCRFIGKFSFLDRNHASIPASCTKVKNKT